ncbi:hypothetical protein PACTADRAFT_36122 [Pachysolen tannophilus NRRL Y-2460]|uniref:Hydantoinase/oxoprolinase N-terminal domain-containing protein n=1 Tax=Pachysolen tannophilus NRRL Y-2460 TaxID=669874 RepID=A0A1E4TP63_PACTA|nr:hypothetical protein PACTADRAFT_36122 [Pachysolen tannophilus NRRL Y-2460]
MTITKQLLIGVDVGGTNTDSVLLNPKDFNTESRGVLSWHKSNTTADVSEGIENGIEKLFEQTAEVSRNEVVAVTIGTTQFINAVIEQDKARLEKVAVLRLCGPYSRGSPPFSDFPEGLRDVTEGYSGFVNGGHRVDGWEIQPLNEQEIRMHCKEILKRGIKAVAIVGIFAIMKKDHELRAMEIVKQELPFAKIVMSHEISGIGFIERENATILNAAVMTFADKIVNSFISAVRNLGLNCPVLLTQNDGTVLSAKDAIKTPIKTFSSGATNSMRGAAFLSMKVEGIMGKTTIVADVGGTTLDCGVLLPSGFPRQSSSYSYVGGVRMNFSMPHVESIGLGGGSIVRGQGENMTIGPDSVGADIVTKSLTFGGDTVTTTDVTLAINTEGVENYDTSLYKVGEPKKVHGKFSQDFKESFSKLLKRKIERIIDRMRTSPEPLPVLFVGGGSFICPIELEGASTVSRPPFFSVANAIGAAIGKISASVHKIQLVTGEDKEAIVEELKKQATERAIEKGALESSITVVDIKTEPIPYVSSTYEFEIKVVGDVDYEKMSTAFKQASATDGSTGKIETAEDHIRNSVYKDSVFNKDKKAKEEEDFDHEKYVPLVNSERQWIISETDLNYIACGNYILGCGGGGSPYGIFLEIREQIRKGHKIRVINLFDAPKYCAEGGFGACSVGFAGSPTISNEQLPGKELVEAINLLSEWTHKKPELVFPLEIGGGNGLQGVYCGSSAVMDLPVVDCDLMGRAYPTHWQTLPVVFGNDKPFFAPSAISDSNGNTILITTCQTDIHMERIMRASLAEIGAHVGVVNPPMHYKDLVTKTVHHSLSLSWRIGRAVAIARQKSEIEKLPQTIIDSVGGSETGKQIFSGKIVGVERNLFKGHNYGEVIIEAENGDMMAIPFKNENILAKVRSPGEKDWKIYATVPDLISVCDADTGEGVGTQDYRYGLLVFVIAMAASELWTNTEKGIEVGGPKAFGPPFEEVPYTPIGKYVAPISVIDEYGPSPASK